jgi:hypothetical protein
MEGVTAACDDCDDSPAAILLTADVVLMKSDSQCGCDEFRPW